MRSSLWAVLRRLTILAVLGCCLALVSLSRMTPEASMVSFCSGCDTDWTTCKEACRDIFNSCYASTGDLTGCSNDLATCLNSMCGADYNFCLDGCNLASPSGNNPECGRGRTTCEQGCDAGKHDCFENGGDTCGEDYQACMDGCCG